MLHSDLMPLMDGDYVNRHVPMKHEQALCVEMYIILKDQRLVCMCEAFIGIWPWNLIRRWEDAEEYGLVQGNVSDICSQVHHFESVYCQD